LVDLKQLKSNIMKFVAVEGVDGAGKSTLVRLLAQSLIEDGYTVLTTREPGGTPPAEAIRSFLLSDEGATVSKGEQLQLVHKGRRHHVTTKIKPALDLGQVVISDRYELSSFVYQVSHAREELEQEFQGMKQELDEILGEFLPTYIMLDLPDTEVERRLKNSEKLNHFDATSIDAIAKRREAYHEGIKAVGDEHHILDATDAPEALVKAARAVLNL
jgi:dTMP kinase